ncbi:MAG: ABC-F family ATP-binding cassette domain-containing protein [Clostridia bacterium]|nr:ABC-F family ATP-binding cassette domain-containing protein [Clostridia bacterium]
MISISCTNVTKYYGIDLILKDLSFTVSAGDRVGLIGKNGAGKTTLFNILAGELSYDDGNIFYAKDISIGYLKQHHELDSELTLFNYCYQVFEEITALETQIRQLEHEIAAVSVEHSDVPEQLSEDYHRLTDAFESQNGYAVKSQVQGVLKGLGFTEDAFDRNVNSLSGGQKSRLNIARLLLTKPDVLFLDEPTNHLDINAIIWLENYLKNYTGTIILVSHDRYFLDQVTNKIIEIENQGILEHNGSYSDFMAFKRQRLETMAREYEKQQKEVARQEEIIRRFKGHGTEKLAKRARSREKALEKVALLEAPTVDNRRAKIRFTSKQKSGTEVLHVQNLSKRFDDKTIFQAVDLSVYANDVIGLIGPNGVGKSTILKILTDQLPSSGGTVKIGHNVIIGYYDQDQSNLTDTNTLFDEISDEMPLLENSEIRRLLGSFLFSGEEVFKEVSSLSGGERGRLSLLKLMLSKSNFLLLDEPTNHLDIPSKEALEEAMLSFEGTILLVSHDRYFLNKVCSKILCLAEDGITEYLGNYDYYLEKQAESSTKPEEEDALGAKTKTQIKDERRKEKEKLAEERRQKKEFEKIEADIHHIEHEILQLETDMCDESLYNDHEKVSFIANQLESLKSQLEQLYEKWEAYL